MATKFKLDEVLGLAKLDDSIEEVDKVLLSTTAVNPEIGQMIEPLIKAGGKRLRPSLVLACASPNGGKINNDVIKLAAATELVHIGSLVHDDIIDESTIRWNIPTISSQDSSQAIVAGDYLLALACALAAEVDQQAAQLTAITITELCAGQNLELADKNNLKRTKANYFKSINGKTASLLSLSCVLGGLMSDLTDQQIKSLQAFGQNWGMSFQLIDDLLDLVSTEKLYGKPVGKDLAEGIYTYPVLLGIEKDQSIQKHLNANIVEILFDNGAIFETVNEIRHYNQLAKNELQSIDSPNYTNLINLPNNYFEWSVENLVAEKYKTKLKEMQKV